MGEGRERRREGVSSLTMGLGLLSCSESAAPIRHTAARLTRLSALYVRRAAMSRTGSLTLAGRLAPSVYPGVGVTALRHTGVHVDGLFTRRSHAPTDPGIHHALRS